MLSSSCRFVFYKFSINSLKSISDCFFQPAVEAFFLVHSPVQDPNAEANKTPEQSHDSQDQSGQSAQSSSTSGDVSCSSDGNNSGRVSVPPDQQKFLNFAEKHRTVLNQILRQTTAHLADGPFSVLVDHTRVLDFDIKRRYFRTELERLDQNLRREETAVHVRREHVFEDSFRELYRRTPEEWKNRFYIVFEGNVKRIRRTFWYVTYYDVNFR